MSSFVLEGVRAEAHLSGDHLSDKIQSLFQRLNDPTHLSHILSPNHPNTTAKVTHKHQQTSSSASASSPPWPVQQHTACSFGGPIARILLSGTSPKLHLLDAFAHPLRTTASFLPCPDAPIVPGGLGWLQGGSILAALSARGELLLYHDLPWRVAAPLSMNISQANEGNNVVLAHVWTGGIVLLTERLEVITVEGVGGRRERCRSRTTLPQELFDNPPRAMAVLQPELMRDVAEDCVVALAHWDQGGVVRVCSNGSITSHVPPPVAVDGEQPVQVKPSMFLKAHPTRELLVSYTTDAKVVVSSADFEAVLYILDVGNSIFSPKILRLPKPFAVDWCGRESISACLVFSKDDARALQLSLSVPSNTAVAVVASVNDANGLMSKVIRGERLTHDPWAVETEVLGLENEVVSAVCEVDGLRVVCESASFLIRPTPDSIRSIFGLASCSPAALLYEAVESVACGGVSEVNTDESIQGLAESDEISAAVNDCMDAAEYVLDAEEAQLLIYIAAYGKRFFPLTAGGDEDSNRLELSKRLKDTSLLCRVCAFLRDSNKCFITPKQLRVLTPVRLLNRLLFLRQFHVAYKLSTIIGVSPAYIVAQWAKMKIQTGSDYSDEALLDSIQAKVVTLPAHHRQKMQFSTIAAFAVKSNRLQLAKALASLDASLPRQVLLLLQLKDYAAAISKVCSDETHDTDLLAFVLLFCSKKVRIGEVSLIALHQAVKNHAKARALLALVWKEQRPVQLEQLFKHLEMFKQHGLLFQEAACLHLDSYDRKAKLVALALQSLKRGDDKGLYKICAEQARLWEMQHDVADSLVGTSLADTILDCFKRKQDEVAEQFFTEFKMKPALFRRIQLRGLCFLRAWDRIDDLSKDKAVLRVISLADFAQVCMDEGNQIEAVKYLLRMDDCADKATLLLELRMWSDSSDAAFNIKDVSTLHLILATCTDEAICSQVSQRINLLQEQGEQSSSALTVADLRQCAQQ